MAEDNNQGYVPYKKWQHQHDEEIRKDFPDRLTEDMAGEIGVSYYTVSRRATRLGVSKSQKFMHMRWASGDHKGRRGKFNGSADEYMREHFCNTSNAEIAKALGVDTKTVRRWARKLGLQKTKEFMDRVRAKGRAMKRYYTDEHLAWRNGRIAEVYPDGTGQQLRQLAEELGIGIHMLRILARKAGLKRSAEGISVAMQEGHAKTRKYSPELMAEVAAYYPDHSTEECAEKFGINLGTLKVYASAHGWKKTHEYRSRLSSELNLRRKDRPHTGTGTL